jgi:hypothetical protein
MIVHKILSLATAGCLIALLVACTGQSTATELAFAVSFTESLDMESLDGRIILIVTDRQEPEPRFQVSAGIDAAQVFGLDVEAFESDSTAVIGSDVLGFPLENLAAIPPGDYYVQAVLHKYETFTLANGKTVKLPMDRGEGQRWNRAPGNLYSTPQKIRVDPTRDGNISIELDQVISPIPEPEDTKYVKHIRIQSDLLTEFWGRPMHLGAHVLLPEGFDRHPNARYPLLIFHGHFPSDFGGFRVEPPDPDLEPDYSARFDVHGYNRIVQQEAYDFYKTWIGPNVPRMLIVEIQHANPYYDDSYAVNSANLGPYGDAITYELIPYIEEQFRGIGAGWARFLYGGSTGGWEALAVQIMYPDEYNGTFAACPDPIDFRAYTLANIYEDQNAYYVHGPFKQLERPGHRNWLGEVDRTLREYNHLELVLGTKNRSGDQWDIWEAVYSPMGEDGYPQRLWDKYTGEIDPDVAEYWRENYDLRYIMERDWATLGPKLQGKIHIYVGDMDNYYLNNAVYLTEEFLESTTNPHYDGEVDYGDRAEHCWNGDHENPNHISRLRYNTMYVPKILNRIWESAPPGADLNSWRY